MAAEGHLNPGWFGHPGSTVIYPLTVAYAAWHTATESGDPLPPVDGLRLDFQADSDDYYYIGRVLSISYFIGAVLLTYLIGKHSFGSTVAITASLFVAVNQTFIDHAQLVRTDSAGAFFGLLALWLILRSHQQATNNNRLLAGAAIGLAISSRYFLAALIPVLAAAELLIFLRQRSASERTLSFGDLAPTLIGPAAAFVAFAVTTPYFFLDFSTARESISAENRSSHLGADGLSRPENLLWYLTDAIPDAMTVPLALLALAGAGLVLRGRHRDQMLPLAFVAVFLFGISYSSLHWQRWLIPVLPILALFAAFALIEALGYVRDSFRLTRTATAYIGVAFVGLVVLWPASNAIMHDIREARPSTRIAAREWMTENLPPGARIAEEWYTAPLAGTGLDYSVTFSLFGGATVRDYSDDGVRYLVTSSNIYDRFFAEPERYAPVVSRYRDLFENGRLIREFEPTDTRGGPVIRIYDVRPASPATGTADR